MQNGKTLHLGELKEDLKKRLKINNMNKLLFLLFFITLISCSSEEETPVQSVEQTPKPETTPAPTPTQYTLTVSSEEGGSVSTEGGTYDEGTTITVTATPSEGYEFVGWLGSDETERELVISVNSNITLSPIFQIIQTNETYYSSGDIINIEPVIFYNRELIINGVKLVAAGDIGGQKAVPDIWIYKTAQVFKLLMNKDSEGIDSEAQLNMIKTLKGEIGWHQGIQTGQRIAYGGGDEYSPNFLTDNGKQSYEGLEAFEDNLALDDMVWYKNIDSKGTGDDDINEILEHTLHTLHRFGARGGVQGSTEALNAESEEGDISNTSVLLAMKEAYDNGMWDYSEFWDGGSLSPEWNDNARTPEGVLANNPLGYELFNTYLKPVISKPSKEILRNMFKDNDQGDSGYTPD